MNLTVSEDTVKPVRLSRDKSLQMRLSTLLPPLRIYFLQYYRRYKIRMEALQAKRNREEEILAMARLEDWAATRIHSGIGGGGQREEPRQRLVVWIIKLDGGVVRRGKRGSCLLQ